jgi:hypothetical protein
MSHKAQSVTSQSRPSAAAITANSVVMWDTGHVGDVILASSASPLLVCGVAEGGSNNSAATSPPNWYQKVTQAGIVQCRSITGTAIAHGDLLKVGDTAGRVTVATIAAAGAGTLTGIVGIAQSVIASGDASDTLVDVLLTPGLQLYV